MTWTPPVEVPDGEFIDAAFMNARVAGNLNFIKDLDGDHYEGDTDADYTTSSTSFADITAGMSLSVATQGRKLLVLFTGCFGASPNDYVILDVSIDGSLQGDSNGLARREIVTGKYPYTIVTFMFVKDDLAANTHTIKPQWKTVGGNTVTLYGGAAGTRLMPQFAVKELT